MMQIRDVLYSNLSKFMNAGIFAYLWVLSTAWWTSRNQNKSKSHLLQKRTKEQYNCLFLKYSAYIENHMVNNWINSYQKSIHFWPFSTYKRDGK